MRFWFSPFPLEEKLQKHLSSEGLQQDVQARRPPDDLLVLYDPPHALAVHAPSGVKVDELTNSYRRLVGLAREGATAVAIPRLQAFTPRGLHDWLKGERPLREVPHAEEPSAMAALLALTLLELRPAMLEAYLDLELHADLLGGAIDGQYLSKLRQIVAAVEPDRLLQDWREPVVASSRAAERIRQLEETLAERDVRIARLGEECRATSFTLSEQRLKQESTEALLEQCRAESSEHQKKMAALQAEQQTLRNRLEEQLRQLTTLGEESKAMAGQIRHAHVELERTFLTSQRGLDLGRQCQVELRRAETLLRRLP